MVVNCFWAEQILVTIPAHSLTYLLVKKLIGNLQLIGNWGLKFEKKIFVQQTESIRFVVYQCQDWHCARIVRRSPIPAQHSLLDQRAWSTHFIRLLAPLKIHRALVSILFRVVKYQHFQVNKLHSNLC